MELAPVNESCLSCNGNLSSATKYFFTCENCKRNVHCSCLEVKNPSELVGDVFFNYICKHCSAFNTEELVRQKMSWVNLLTLALYNLRENSLDVSRNGFFHWKIHICNLIEKNWTSFFGINAKKKKTWIGTVSGTLSHYSPQYFLSGQKVLNESGWWKLSHSLTPVELVQKCGKGGSLALGLVQHPPIPLQDMERTIEEDGGDEAVDSPIGGQYSSPCLTPGRQSSTADDQESDSQSGSSSSVRQVHSTHRSAMYSRAYVQPSATLSDCLFADDEEDESLLDIDVDSGEVSMKMEVDSFGGMEIPQSSLAVKVPCNPLSNDLREVADIFLQPDSSLPSMSSVPQPVVKSEEEEEETLPQPEKSLFTRSNRKSPMDQLEEKIISRVKELGGVPMSEYMEVKLLNSMRRALAAPLKQPPPSSAHRLFRKLTVRKMKRERGLPVFNLDRFTGVQGKASASWQQVNAFISAENTSRSERVLDRYRLASHLTVTNSYKSPGCSSFLSHLFRGSEFFCFKSPYTNRMLKPFIRRDHRSFPLWVKLMVELVETVRKKNLRGVSVPEYRVAPIEYSYVRPWHIPAINSMAREFFWPGIDLSDCLQYPDFSCVVLYRKLVVAFAVMVPDVRHNETYISFLFTRPEWRKAGIATFMLYHLIQTCMGKDITLHVSATNPALILYQKFGFKVEEFIQDFYETYLPINSRECKHALFLRLSR